MAQPSRLSGRLVKKAAANGRIMSQFPTRVLATDGVKVARANAVYTFSLDFDALSELTPIVSADRDNLFVALWNSDLATFRKAALSTLLDVGGTVEAWDADLDAIAALSGTGIAARTASNTWALRSLTAPAAGFTIANNDGVSGNPTFVLANDLAAYEGLSTTGIVIRTGDGTATTRSIAVPAAGISITNADGVSGAPTLALANDLLALEALASTGFAARTTTDTWAQRTLQAPGAGLTISNPAGIAGDPTFALANDLAALEGLSSTGIAARTAADTWAQRTLTGTASRLTVTNGDGVSGDPTLDISASYVGQASITTLGTVATGTWQATAVDATHGGTAQTTYALGDLLYSSATNTLAKLAGNITSTKKFLRQTGTGAVSAAPAWDTIVAADVPASALTKTDDTNVTLTLGGSPSTALLNAASLTLGWTGTLAVSRGGTGGGSASGTLLDNISGFASTGMLARTAAGTYAFRTIAGTANRITLSNGDGVAGAPTIDISSAYVGQSTITTLGTLTTGTWTATKIGLAYGGTNADLSATGGTSQVLKQTSVGGAITVAQLAASDLSNGTSGSGAVALVTSPVFVTPTLGAAAGTSLALGGATIGGNALAVTGTTLHTGAVTVSTASFSLSGNIAAAAWTTSGIRYKNIAATLTDTSSSGTVATAYTDVWGGNTIAASSATTFTNYFGSYFVAPVTGTNVTFTNAWALGGDSLKVGTSNQVTISAAGILSATNAAFTTPNIGVATATSINKMAITAPATSSTLAVADGKTATISNTLTFTGTDTSSVAFGAGGTVAYVANNLSVFAATTSAQLAGVISDETGTGALVFAASPTLTNPVVGTQTLGDNTTKAASTAFVTAAVAASTAGVASIGGSTGTIALGGAMSIAANVLSDGWSTGDAKLTFKTTADAGWILCDDGSIGDGSSSATTRANADTSALFTLLYNNISALVVQDSSGGTVSRGANAAADFAAHRRLVIPKTLGRSIAIAGAGSGLTSRTLGATAGAETETPTTAKTAAHTHITNLSTTATAGSGYSSFSDAGGHGAVNTDAGTGSGTALNILDPTTYMNIMIKL